MDRTNTFGRPEWQGILLKALAFMPVFIVLNFSYRWLPYPWAQWLLSTSEAVFDHAKVIFYGYILLSLLEFALVRRRVPDRGRFLYSRLAATVFLPWGMLVLWYIVPALYGQRMPSSLLEIIYGNVVLLVLMLLAGILERSLEQHTFSRGARAVLWVFFSLFLVEAVIFSYRLPWADFFTPVR